MKIIAVTQARVGSSRLPAKVLKQIGDTSLLEIHLERICRSKTIDKLIVATTNRQEDEAIIKIAQMHGLNYYQGSADDVLDRYYQAVKSEKADYIIRLTSDCPLIDWQLIDQMAECAIKQNLDYLSNTLKPSFPDGQDIEIIKFSALELAWKNAMMISEREHVTPFVWKNSSYNGGTMFSSFNFMNEIDYSQVRLTVDENKDFETIKILIQTLGAASPWLTYAKYYLQHHADMLNSSIDRNQGYKNSLSADKN